MALVEHIQGHFIMAMQVKEYPPVVKLGTVCEITTLSKSSVYDLIKKGQFPASRTLFSNRVVWATAEVLAWLESNLSKGAAA